MVHTRLRFIRTSQRTQKQKGRQHRRVRCSRRNQRTSGGTPSSMDQGLNSRAIIHVYGAFVDCGSTEIRVNIGNVYTGLDIEIDEIKTNIQAMKKQIGSTSIQSDSQTTIDTYTNLLENIVKCLHEKYKNTQFFKIFQNFTGVCLTGDLRSRLISSGEKDQFEESVRTILQSCGLKNSIVKVITPSQEAQWQRTTFFDIEKNYNQRVFDAYNKANPDKPINMDDVTVVNIGGASSQVYNKNDMLESVDIGRKEFSSPGVKEITELILSIETTVVFFGQAWKTFNIGPNLRPMSTLVSYCPLISWLFRMNRENWMVVCDRFPIYKGLQDQWRKAALKNLFSDIHNTTSWV